MTQKKIFIFSWICFCAVFLYISCSSSKEHFDLIIKNTTIVDGTGNPRFKGDVGIKQKNIAAVGRVRGEADIIIDGTDLVTCPGFIDTHSHADLSILKYPLAENLVMQGVTTFVGGNCGLCPAPRAGTGDKANATGDNPAGKWTRFGEFLSVVEESGLSVNYIPLVGHNAIRSAVMGDDFKRPATATEIEEMKDHVEEAMASGAFGLSSFFDPSPGEYARVEEIVELAKVAQKYGGLYSPHTRHHQNQWWAQNPQEYGYGLFHAAIGEIIAGRYHGLLEAIEISKKANNIPLLIAHFTPAYKIPQPHPVSLQEAVAQATLAEIIDKPRQEGLKVHFNVIACSFSVGAQEPVISSFFNPQLALPDWLKTIEKADFVEGLKSRVFRNKVRDVINSGRLKFGMLHPLTDPYWIDCYRILTCDIEEYEGKTLGEIARMRRPDSIIDAVYYESIEALFDILHSDPDATWALILDKREFPGALPVFLKHPAGMPCIDCVALPAVLSEQDSGVFYGTSPISYGLFPYFINLFVKEKTVLSLEEAVKKASYVAAQEVLGLKDRGVIRAGAYADLVVFDLASIGMSGDYFSPNTPPDGIQYVFINGTVAYKDKAHTGEKTGMVIRRPN